MTTTKPPANISIKLDHVFAYLDLAHVRGNMVGWCLQFNIFTKQLLGHINDHKYQQLITTSWWIPEWLAFVDLLRNNSLVNDTSDYGAVFSQFVGESCAPGAKDKDIDIPNTDGEKLCSNCYPVDVTQS